MEMTMKKKFTVGIILSVILFAAGCSEVESTGDAEFTDAPVSDEADLTTEQTYMETGVYMVETAAPKSSSGAETSESLIDEDIPLADDDNILPVGGEPEDSDYSSDNYYIDNDYYRRSDDEITKITLSFYETTLYTGDTVMPYVTMYPEDAPDKSELWESSDTEVAQVDEIGNITAVGAGDCVVAVRSAACPNVWASVKVKVKETVTEPTYIDGIIIANKTYALPADYNPGVDPDAQAAFDEMQEAAAEEGLNLYISSGFRSYEYQGQLYEGYVEKSGKAAADRYSARPGHSEHQTGLAFDLNTIDISFAQTEEYEWIQAHCAEYGFIIRYPEDGEEITGYMYEPWHIRYLGKEIAKKVYDSGLTLEEYLGIDSKYDDD